MAAPVGEVMTPMRRGSARQRPLALGGEQALGREPCAQLLELALQRAAPGILDVSRR